MPKNLKASNFVNESNKEKAIDFICQREASFAALIKKESVTRSVYKMLKDGGFDLDCLPMRSILEVFL